MSAEQGTKRTTVGDLNEMSAEQGTKRTTVGYVIGFGLLMANLLMLLDNKANHLTTCIEELGSRGQTFAQLSLVLITLITAWECMRNKVGAYEPYKFQAKGVQLLALVLHGVTMIIVVIYTVLYFDLSSDSACKDTQKGGEGATLQGTGTGTVIPLDPAVMLGFGAFFWVLSAATVIYRGLGDVPNPASALYTLKYQKPQHTQDRILAFAAFILALSSFVPACLLLGTSNLSGCDPLRAQAIYIPGIALPSTFALLWAFFTHDRYNEDGQKFVPTHFGVIAAAITIVFNVVIQTSEPCPHEDTGITETMPLLQSIIAIIVVLWFSGLHFYDPVREAGSSITEAVMRRSSDKDKSAKRRSATQETPLINADGTTRALRPSKDMHTLRLTHDGPDKKASSLSFV
jgi:hypothetical protein